MVTNFEEVIRVGMSIAKKVRDDFVKLEEGEFEEATMHSDSSLVAPNATSRYRLCLSSRQIHGPTTVPRFCLSVVQASPDPATCVFKLLQISLVNGSIYWI
jgi:hypothetical protein